MSDVQILFGANKTKSIGGIEIDAFVTENHKRSCVATEYPVEDGSVFTDHIHVNPDTLSITGVVGSSKIANQEGGFTRVFDVYQELSDLIDKKEPVTIVTGLKVYDNMVLENFSVDRDKSTGSSLNFSLDARQIKVIQTQSIAIPKSKLIPKTDAVSTKSNLQAQTKADMGKQTGGAVDSVKSASFLDTAKLQLGM